MTAVHSLVRRDLYRDSVEVMRGIGQSGTGIVRAPLACFTAAIEELGRRLGLLT